VRRSGPGWETARSRSTGKQYYANRQTGQSTYSWADGPHAPTSLPFERITDTTLLCSYLHSHRYPLIPPLCPFGAGPGKDLTYRFWEDARQHVRDSLYASEVALVGLLSGGATAVMTCPLDVVNTRCVRACDNDSTRPHGRAEPKCPARAAAQHATAHHIYASMSV
jgi:hypothetical protein